MTNSAVSAPTEASAILRLVFARTRSIIDFLEELVVLSDLGIVRVEFERFLVRLARLFELALVLVRNREIVEGRGVGGIDFDGLLPPVDRFAPQAALRHADAELHLRFRVFSRVGPRCGNRREN